MVKRAKGRRQANQKNGTQKKKTGRNINGQNIFEQLEDLLPRKVRDKLYEVAEYTFKLIGDICCKLCFVPLSITPEGDFVIKTKVWEKSLHYFLVGLQCIRTAYSLVSTLERATFEGVHLPTVLAMTTTLFNLTAMSVSSSLLFKRFESVQLLNAAPKVMEYFPKDGKTLRVLENSKSVVMVLSIGSLSAGVALIASTLGFMVDSLPGSLFEVFNATGVFQIFPRVPPFVWKLMLYPTEMFMFFQSIIVAAWSGMILLSLPNMVIACTNRIREMPVKTVKQWIDMRRQYGILQAFFALGNSWIRFMIVPSIAGTCGSIIIALYITIRHHELPILIYLGFPYIAASMLGCVYGFGFEVLNLIRETECIMEALVSSSRRNFDQLADPEERLHLKKLARALRPAVFDIGDFMKYSVDVPVGMGDEMINQLVFLLTL